MTLEEIREPIELLFNPEPNEGGIVRRAFACPLLEKTHGLDLSYLKTIDWEGSSVHPHTRLRGGREDALDLLTRNSDMPHRLMLSALQFLADSILAYHDKEEREGEIRYYPAIVLTFWSGFECFVSLSSEGSYKRCLMFPRRSLTSSAKPKSRSERHYPDRGEISVCP